MEGMFMKAKSFERSDIRRWDVSRVTNMNNMFFEAQRFYGNQGNLGWCIPATTTNFAKDSGCDWRWKRPNCGVTFESDCGDSSSNNSKTGSTTIIIVCCVVAAVLLVAALFFWNKRAEAMKQPHREASMITIGKDDVEVPEASAN